MTPVLLLADLHAAGFRLRVDGDRLIVAPASRLTAEQRAVIAAEKATLIALLSGPALLGWGPSPDEPCPRCGERLIRGGLACAYCEQARCVACGAWLGRFTGAFCASCRAEGGDA